MKGSAKAVTQRGRSESSFVGHVSFGVALNRGFTPQIMAR